MKVTICSLVYLFLLSKQAAVKGADEADLSLRGSRQLLQLSITKLQLYNALTGKLITDLSPGQTVIVQGMSSPAFNIKAVVPNGDIKSIRFGLDSNPGYSLKNGSPYSLCGMRSGSNYNVCPELNFNTHTVTAVPFASKNGQGTQGPTVSFSLTISSSSGTTLPPPSVKTPQVRTGPVL